MFFQTLFKCTWACLARNTCSTDFIHDNVNNGSFLGDPSSAIFGHDSKYIRVWSIATQSLGKTDHTLLVDGERHVRCPNEILTNITKIFEGVAIFRFDLKWHKNVMVGWGRNRTTEDNFVMTWKLISHEIWLARHLFCANQTSWKMKLPHFTSSWEIFIDLIGKILFTWRWV